MFSDFLIMDIDGNEMKQGIDESEDVISRYGMLKSGLVVVVQCDTTSLDLAINNENILFC